jgi:hypothetical protein
VINGSCLELLPVAARTLNGGVRSVLVKHQLLILNRRNRTARSRTAQSVEIARQEAPPAVWSSIFREP